MKEYELTVLIHSGLEADIEAPINKVHEIIKSAGGEITREDNWGKKKLAYRINKEDFAIYVYMELTLPADALLKISNTLNITDEVLRYLLVKFDEKARKAQAEKAKEEADSDDSKKEVKEEE